jgi:hypothetical protein
MPFYLWVVQKGEGCDYTIGCGEAVHHLRSVTIDDIEREVKRIIQDCGYDSEYRRCERATLLTSEKDLTYLLHEAEKASADLRAEEVKAGKLEQLERLKKELGVK